MSNRSMYNANVGMCTRRMVRGGDHTQIKGHTQNACNIEGESKILAILNRLGCCSGFTVFISLFLI